MNLLPNYLILEQTLFRRGAEVISGSYLSQNVYCFPSIRYVTIEYGNYHSNKRGINYLVNVIIDSFTILTSTQVAHTMYVICGSNSGGDWPDWAIGVSPCFHCPIRQFCEFIARSGDKIAYFDSGLRKSIMWKTRCIFIDCFTDRMKESWIF